MWETRMKAAEASSDERVKHAEQVIIIIMIINMRMPVQQNNFTHLRVLLVLTDRDILVQSN
jgi:hypothetical protein